MSRRGENIYKRKDGRWEGRYRDGFHANGKPKYRSIYGHSYQEVKSRLLPLKAALPHAISSGKLTVGTLLEEWLTAVRLRVKPSSYANYRMKADKHILPMFGGLQYELLTADRIHLFIAKKLKSGLSAKYIADIVIMMKSMAKYISHVHGFRNAIAKAVLPKVERKEKRLFTEQQQKQLCRYVMRNFDSTSLCILLSLYMGLRIGEICGLQWGDIDFLKGILTVKRTVQRIRAEHGTTLMVDSPKSKASLRMIPIPTFLMGLLQKFRQSDDSYILSGNHTVIEPRTLQHRFKALLKKAELPSVNYHSLRHMFATNSIRAGFDVRTLSEILGHASVSTTLSRYVHSSMTRKTECMELLTLAF